MFKNKAIYGIACEPFGMLIDLNRLVWYVDEKREKSKLK